MIRRVLKVLGWLVGGTITLCVILYLIALAINWRDREPSEAAIEITTLFQQRPKVDDADNAFVYLMGFEVPVGEDPQAMGIRRVTLMQQPHTAGSARIDPLKDPPEREPMPLLEEFRETCGPYGDPGGKACAAAFEASDALLTQWLAIEGWRLDRYRVLIARTGWYETLPQGTLDPFPHYGSMMDGQKLLLLQARALAMQGNVIGAIELLETDHWFWRRVLESSDTLISKMIANAGLTKNFEWGNLIVRRLQSQGIPSSIPTAWRTPISDAERSLQRCMVGEWQWLSGFVREEWRYGYDEEEDSPILKVSFLLAKPLVQHQDLLNSRAVDFLYAVRRWNVSLDQYAAAVLDTEQTTRNRRARAWPPRSAYNLVGQWVMRESSDFTDYARRIGDIEGLRRATLTAAMLREAHVAAADVQAALAGSGALRNPYTNAPFLWDEPAAAVVFQGLEKGKRSRHRIYY